MADQNMETEVTTMATHVQWVNGLGEPMETPVLADFRHGKNDKGHSREWLVTTDRAGNPTIIELRADATKLVVRG